MKRLIVNADDFGRARGVNAGILRAHRDGIVTAATLMVSAPATDDAARAARATPSLDVGVHLTVTYGRPISDPAAIRSLVEHDGSFPRLPAAFLGTGRADRDEALTEYRAQFARAQELLGRAPTHLDSHHWLHDEPALEWAVIALGSETGTAVRPHDDAQRGRLRAAGVRAVDRYRRDFQHDGHVDIPTLERILADIDDGVTELGCHPGEPDAALARTSTYAALRVDELATLTDPSIKTAIARNGITLSTYSRRPMTFAKALWVVRDRITTTRGIDDLLADSVGWNIRDLVVQVRGRGDAYYASALEPRAEALLDPALDPLAYLVRGGAAVGVRIHAWANGTFVWSSPGGSLPRSPAHLANAHPDWLLRPDGVRYQDPVGGSDWEGIYIDPTNAAARSHTVEVFTDIVRRYAVEGFHHDYIRYPQATYASSPEDHRAITALVRETTARLRAARPEIVISAAVFPDPAVARERVLQRWPEWAAEKLIDLVCPMAYQTDTAEVRRLLGAARDAAPSTPMWGGLMAYVGERALVRDQVRAARDAGCDGAILFAYDTEKRDVIDAFAAEAER